MHCVDITDFFLFIVDPFYLLIIDFNGAYFFIESIFVALVDLWMFAADNVFDIFLTFTLVEDFYFTIFYLELILFEANLGPSTTMFYDE